LNANQIECKPNPDGLGQAGIQKGRKRSTCKSIKEKKEILVAVPATTTTTTTTSISLFMSLAVDKQYSNSNQVIHT
jgi:hypothetical protein